MKLTDKRLIAFLKLKGVYEQYLRNVENEKDKEFWDNPNDIGNSFFWDDSPEGFYFWYSLSYEYKTLEQHPKGKNSYHVHGGELR